ncbi:Ig-like domain-containing protein [Cytophagaceae bacterium DM2B3-1]|uniref:Ig-like domain-containing protein n=1 Tax=Xanthocytophaga flava TaxID=3048013 RepID=A0ABT7CNU8_9BACT|nr:Ig-like domain-containing protein [Xanthocytophaga flavus]MDJ1466218.1 Ig-like domain-containing protein [Xanthocytophaga flavus]MDJ1495423.1 Ig-like domain-containing protein [Xanthocytophaga flavus]
MKNIKNYWWLVAFIALFIYACDIINKDSSPAPSTLQNGTTLYTAPKTGLAINLLKMEEYKGATGFRITQQPTNGKASFVKDATLLYLPDTTKNVSSDYFLLTVSTGDSLSPVSVVDTIIIKFTPTDSLPCSNRVVSDNFSTSSNTPITMNVLSNDSFCQGVLDSTTLTIIRATEHGSVGILSNRQIVYTPSSNYEGPDYFIYQVCSNTGVCAMAVVTIQVTQNTSNCLQAVSDSFAIQTAYSLFLDVLANDALCSGQAAPVLTIISAPQYGSAEVSGNKIFYGLYTTNSDYKGMDYIYYRICQGSVCDTAKVALLIDASVCTNILYSDTITYKPTSLSDSLYTKGASFPVLKNDDLRCVYYGIRIAEQPSNGVASIRDHRVVFKANPGFVGKDSLQYSVCVTEGSCTQKATVYFDIK